MPIFGEWLSPSVSEHPGVANVEPAQWYYWAGGVDFDATTWPNPIDENFAETPTAAGTANTEFEEEWPGPPTDRHWLSYWEQPDLNLNALGLYAGGNGVPGDPAHRGMAQEVWFLNDVPAVHPGFGAAPAGWDLIQFEDEDEPFPIADGQASRGRPTEYIQYRIEIEAAITRDALDGYGTVPVEGGTATGVYTWGLESTSYDRDDHAGSGGFARKVGNGTNEFWGVIEDDDAPYLGTGLPSAWAEEFTEHSINDAATHTITFGPDGSGFSPQLLLRMVMGELQPDPSDPEDPEYGDAFNTVEVVRMRFFTQVQWPAYRYAKSNGGMWNVRQRQSLAGNAGGYPTRQRQNGGATGSWPHRQRQTGL